MSISTQGQGQAQVHDQATAGQDDVIVVGAGFAGMYLVHRLRGAGYGVKCFDAGSGPGGTWHWNRYPGARCDIHSLAYSYSFSKELEQEWEWSELYAAQPEIERYANHVADRFDLRRSIEFNTWIVSCSYDEAEHRWTVITDKGQSASATYLIMAIGGYSIPAVPQIPGIETFKGEAYFTNQWPQHEVDFSGKRVGIIGTGSSGTQTATEVAAANVEHLHVFQRTANFVVPGWNRAADAEYTNEFKAGYAEFREAARWSGNGTVFPRVKSLGQLTTGPIADLDADTLEARLAELWQTGGLYFFGGVSDLMTSEVANERVSEFFRQKIRERVSDPKLAELLMPRGFFIGERRIIAENGYLDIFNQPEVSLVDVKSDPITQVTASGVKTRDSEYPLDILILATGFDSGTGAMLKMDVRGKAGQQFKDKWADGPSTYLGLAANGFPNMFMIAQPGSPSIRSQVLVSIEQHVDWVFDMIEHAREAGVVEIEASQEAEDAWTKHVCDVASKSLFARSETQYVGANVPGKPRVYLAYLGGVSAYRKTCDTVRENAYEGFVLKTESGALPGSESWSGANEIPSVWGTAV
ncbi:MAG: cyclohexanone monooxygenase [Gammaproteobacteria bacterium]|jgi:cyclohexanone monooxygenase